jgi:2-dehydro-3-deoxyphosphogluconate aldolase/(4S)-4-hydroxy-2-oxoglutarate aldolase
LKSGQCIILHQDAKGISLVDTSSLRNRLKNAPVVPLVQADNPETAIKIANALVAGGLTVIEVVLRTSTALECLKEVAASVPGAIVGAGTVLNVQQAQASIDAGAQFIVCPGLHVPVVEAAQSADLPIIPGVATASELQQAWNLGLRLLKFFPASLAGGPSMIKALGSAFRDVEFMPTGGVSAANLTDYLALANVIACGGSWLTPTSAVIAGDFATITRLAAEAVAIAKSVEV